jgi:hypothetical protein
VRDAWDGKLGAGRRAAEDAAIGDQIRKESHLLEPDGARGGEAEASGEASGAQQEVSPEVGPPAGDDGLEEEEGDEDEDSVESAGPLLWDVGDDGDDSDVLDQSQSLDQSFDPSLSLDLSQPLDHSQSLDQSVDNEDGPGLGFGPSRQSQEQQELDARFRESLRLAQERLYQRGEGNADGDSGGRSSGDSGSWA